MLSILPPCLPTILNEKYMTYKIENEEDGIVAEGSSKTKKKKKQVGLSCAKLMLRLTS